MVADRKHIPAGVKRRLRVEAGFGCCKCGFPITEYHHIIEYSREPKHDPADMMLLCPNHHDEVTRGVVSEWWQRSWKAQPHNLSIGTVSHALNLSHAIVPAISAGTCIFKPSLLIVGGEKLLLAVEGGPLGVLISGHVYGEDGRELATIRANEWESHVSEPFDIEAGWNHLVLRSGPRRVAIDVSVEGQMLVLRAELWHEGHRVSIRDDGFFVDWPGGRPLLSLEEVLIGHYGIYLDAPDPTTGEPFSGFGIPRFEGYGDLDELIKGTWVEAATSANISESAREN